MTVERFVIQNFKDWEQKARRDGKSHHIPEDRARFAKDIAVGCFYSEEEILKAIGRYISYNGEENG